MDEHEHLEMQESCQVLRGALNLTFVYFTGKKRRKKKERGKSFKPQNCVNLKTL